MAFSAVHEVQLDKGVELPAVAVGMVVFHAHIKGLPGCCPVHVYLEFAARVALPIALRVHCPSMFHGECFGSTNLLYLSSFVGQCVFVVTMQERLSLQTP